MIDKRFFPLKGPFTVEQLAEVTGTEVGDDKFAEKLISDVATLDKAKEFEVSFFDNKKYIEEFKNTKCGACFIRQDVYDLHPPETACLIGENPYKAYAKAAEIYHPGFPLQGKIADSAIIDKTATIGFDCVIEPGVIIGANAKIGDRCIIGANTVIRNHVEICNDCKISPHVYISHAFIGSKVHLSAGVKIGSPGFGFAIDPEEGFVSVPQLGRVIIEDNVHIGSNTTVDRGSAHDTIIGYGTRIDNLVQIAHNVRIGSHCIIVSQSGIAGSTHIGDNVIIGGQTGIAGHLKIGTGAKIAGQSGVMRDIPEGDKEYMGLPAVPIKENMRKIAILAKIAIKKNKSNNDDK